MESALIRFSDLQSTSRLDDSNAETELSTVGHAWLAFFVVAVLGGLATYFILLSATSQLTAVLIAAAAGALVGIVAARLRVVRTVIAAIIGAL